MKIATGEDGGYHVTGYDPVLRDTFWLRFDGNRTPAPPSGRVIADHQANIKSRSGFGFERLLGGLIRGRGALER